MRLVFLGKQVGVKMKPQDWFGLGVRFTGVWCAIQTILNVMYFLDVRLGFSQLRSSSSSLQDFGSPVGYLIYAAGYAVLATYFLLGTGHLTALTFGKPPSDQEQEDEPKIEEAHPDSE